MILEDFLLINDSVEQIIQDYNSVIKVIEGDALAQNNRSYGGMIRSERVGCKNI